MKQERILNSVRSAGRNFNWKLRDFNVFSDILYFFSGNFSFLVNFADFIQHFIHIFHIIKISCTLLQKYTASKRIIFITFFIFQKVIFFKSASRFPLYYRPFDLKHHKSPPKKRILPQLLIVNYKLSIKNLSRLHNESTYICTPSHLVATSSPSSDETILFFPSITSTKLPSS